MDYYKEANCLLNNAGLRLQAWGSNKIQLTKKAENEGVDDNSPLTKVLGLSWKPATDSLQVPSTRLNVYCHSKSTNRDILRGISGVYDPLGFIMPLTIPARILIQDIWKLKLDWDDLLPLDRIERWSVTRTQYGITALQPPTRQTCYPGDLLSDNFHRLKFGSMGHNGFQRRTSGHYGSVSLKQLRPTILQPLQMLWTTAIILRLAPNIKLRDKSRARWIVGHITVTELKKAEHLWILSAQKQHFSSEFGLFHKPKHKAPTSYFTGSFNLRGHKEATKIDRKADILLFTCASSRAIHLEVVEDLTTISFLEAFRCFVSHHSRPAVIISDNAKTFEKAAKTFQKVFRDPLVLRQLSDQQVEWRFIPKRAPCKPTFNAYQALVADAEVVMNECPLQEPSSHVGDQESLCPAHLMYGRRLNTLPYNEELTEEILDLSYAERPNELKKALVRHQTLLKQFEKRFINSYLPALREYHQATKKGQTTVIKEKDVVLVHDEKPRKEWKLAVVENLI
ncbi:Uncharacterized protein APZ42_027900 [Daphnia magna]|uniref:Uncharacterized protein n=1 Tax=Daphnia magna TaxID=35525 RepID=A0A164QZ50_9CRUS|nr:Uncharacterized protein APZ42_027900 [Daphnia magna]